MNGPQNIGRRPNCDTRRPPTVVVMVPKSPLSKLFSGMPKFTVSNTLNISNRNSACARPPRRTRFEMLKSTRRWAGPRRKFRGVLPAVPSPEGTRGSRESARSHSRSVDAVGQNPREPNSTPDLASRSPPRNQYSVCPAAHHRPCFPDPPTSDCRRRARPPSPCPIPACLGSKLP